MPDHDLQRRAARLVSQNVLCCLSGLVATLAGDEGYISGIGMTQFGTGRGLADGTKALAAKAVELAAPIPDYESAAREAGWRNAPLYGIVKGGLPEGADNTDDAARDPEADDYDMAAGWQDACYGSGIDPHDREVYEYWAVTDWLADKLEAKGEKVDRDFTGLTVWARTTTGQAISIDSVIEDITAETGFASEG